MAAEALAPTIRTFQVFPDVPDPLQPLLEVAHNPVKLLGVIDQGKLAAAATDEGYLAHMNRVHAEFKEHLEHKGWFNENNPDKAKMLVAYFSAEFGLHESLPIYSGGLGILAGDHLKSASELGIPLVGVGLLYRNGYFQQYLSADGWQQEAYPELDFYNLAVEPLRYTDGSPVHVRVDLPENAVFCKVWRVKVGRIPLYLLDTNLQKNSPADREITSRLYGG